MKEETNLFVSGYPQTGNLPKLRKVCLHFFFIESMGYAAEEENTTLSGLEGVSHILEPVRK